MDARSIYVREVNQESIPDHEEQRTLCLRLARSCGAPRRALADELLRRNQRLVLKRAYYFLSRGEKVGLTLMDLVQEGNLGLMTAIEKFQVELGFALSTYATQWIDQSIRRAIADSLRVGVRIPVHATEVMNKVDAARTVAWKELGRDPTPHEVLETLERLVKERQWKTVTLEMVGKALKLLHRSQLNLDAPSGDEDHLPGALHNVLPDRKPRADGVAEAKQQLKQIEEVLSRVEEAASKLSPRSCEVIGFRLGLFGKPELTLEEIGERYEVTRERIRQIEEKGLETVSSEVGFTADEIRELLRMRSHLLEYITAV